MPATKPKSGQPRRFRDPRAARKAALAEAKVKARIRADGRRWFAPFEACEYLGIAYPTLRRWQKSCPWLNGQGVETRPLRGHFNRLTPYYAKDDLDRISQARAHREPVPEVPGHTHMEEAARQLGVHTATLRRLMKAKKVKPKSVSTKGSDGRARRRKYVATSFITECKAERASGAPADTITVEEGADILGVGATAVHWHIDQGNLTPRRGITTDKAGRRRRRVLLSRGEVESLKKTRERRNDVAQAGGQNGRWQTAADIMRRRAVSRAGRIPVETWLKAAHKSGALTGEMRERYYPNSGHGQVRKRLHYNDDQLDALLAGRPLEDVAREFAKAGVNGRPPAPVTPGVRAKGKRGRKFNPTTQAINEACYIEYYTNDRSRGEVMRIVNQMFGPCTILNDKDVKDRADRWATKDKHHPLPIPSKSPKPR